MSFLLRHGCEKEGVSIRADGYVLMNDLLSWLNKKKQTVTIELVNYVVESCTKKRFEVLSEGDQLFIRAAQGHTLKEVKTEELLTKITDPFEFAEIVHGTYF